MRTSKLGFIFLVVVLLAVLLVSAVFVLGMGSVHIPPLDVLDVVLRRFGVISGNNVTVLNDTIVWELRAPRVVGAIMVGVLLAICGAILQTLTGNELADPYLLGISSGASVGAVFVLVVGITAGIAQSTLMALASFIGALVALILVLAMATGKSGQLPPGRTILSGVAVGQLCGAAVSLMIMVFGNSDVARAALAWTLGSMAGMRWPGAVVMLIVGAISIVVCVKFSTILDAFAFGDVSAASLGIPVTAVRWAFMVGTALLTAISVAYVGPIGFIGLTVPHIVRLLVGPKHTRVLPMSALVGGIILLWSDTFARSISSSEIPIGVVTAVIGAPVLVYLLRLQARRS